MSTKKLKKEKKGHQEGSFVDELDPRFKTDARFIPVAKNASKLKVDKRFQPLFTSEAFKVRSESSLLLLPL